MYTGTKGWVGLWLGIMASGIALSGVATPVKAADEGSGSSDAPAQIEEIVVTAQRRAENQQQVPIAVSTVSGAQIRDTGIGDTQALMSSVPGLNITENTGNTLLFIRGIGTTGVATDNDVGIYVDGVYIASEAAGLMSLGDIEQVEVLKGPQGTLFGRNSVGGVVQLTTKTPSSAPSADVSVGYGNFDTSTFNFYGTTEITSNIATDFALYYNDQIDGWGRDVTTGTQTFTNKDISLRNKWVFTPSDATKFTFAVDYSELKSQDGIYWSILPGSLGVDGKTRNDGFYNSASSVAENDTNSAVGAMVRLDQDFGWARGVSISAYRHNDNTLYADHSATPEPPIITNVVPGTEDDRTYSEELQLLSPVDSKVQWIVGLFDLYDTFLTPGFTIVAAGGQVEEILNTTSPTHSYAAFGQARVEVLADTYFTGGLRYTKDYKSISGHISINDDDLPPSYQSNEFSKVTYRAVLDHQFTPDILGYVSYDTGYKSGEYNVVTPAAPPVNPESLTAYQAGVKSEYLDHRLRVNAAAFLYNYSNIQITEVEGASIDILNATSAKLYGADVDLDAVVGSAFKIHGALSYLHGRYGDYPNAPSYVPAAGGGNTPIQINATGNTTVQSPEVTAYVEGNYTVPFARGAMDLDLNVSENSGYYWDVDNRVKQPAYALLGGYVKWLPAQASWDVRAWAKNITGKKYYSFEEAQALGDVVSPAAPRTFGASVHYHF
jgi:iron complex outermembrane receptor protein